MAIALASKPSMLTMLSANMNGIVNEASKKPMFMFTGEALTVNKSSPTVSCHQGEDSDTTITKIVVRPPARANQLNFVKIPLIHLTPDRLDSEPASPPSRSHPFEFEFH